MLPITPPSSEQKSSSIYDKPLPYHEDSYRAKTPENTFEQDFDACESDNDSDAAKTKSVIHRAFFKRFAIPKTQTSEASVNGEGLSQVRNRGANIFTYLDKRSTASSLSPPPPSHVDNKAAIYEIAPSINAKHSIEVTLAKEEANKLAPSRFGMFSGSLEMLPAIDLPNTAKQMMDDMLPNMETADESAALVAEARFTPVNAQETMADLDIRTETQVPLDGDVKGKVVEPDDATDTIRQIQKRRGRPPGARNKTGRQKVDAGSPLRKSARREAMLQSLKEASRSPARVASKTKSKTGRGQGSIWSPLPRKKSTTRKRVFHNQKPGLRLRNYKGELAEDGKPIVVIFDDEVGNVEEFVRLWE